MTHRRTLLVGCSGLDWDVLHRHVDAGRLPALRRMIEQGTLARLPSCGPPVAAATWMTIATGRWAFDHGILHDQEIRPEGIGFQPVTSRSLRARPVWEIAAGAGRRSVAVGFPATRHAECPGAVIVSDAFAAPAADRFERWITPRGSLSPFECRASLDPLRLHPEDIDPDQIAFLLPAGVRTDVPAADRDYVRFALARCATLHSVATHLIETDPAGLVCVHLDLIGRMSRRFGAHAEVIERSYVFLDMIVHRYRALMTGEGTVVIVSDHGYGGRLGARAAGGPNHRPVPDQTAILIAQGPLVRRDQIVLGGSLCDVAPTVLALVEAPVPTDLPGRALQEIFVHPVVVAEAESTPTRAAARIAAAEIARMAASLEEERIIVPKPDEEMSGRIFRFENERLFARAASLIAAGAPARAVPVLRELVARAPSHSLALLRLAECLLALREIEECKRLFALVPPTPGAAPWAHYVRAELERLCQGSETAAQSLTEAWRLSGGLPQLCRRIGESFLALGRPAEAEACFRDALRSPVERAQSLDGLGVALMRQGRLAGAIKALQASIATACEEASVFRHLEEAYGAAGDFSSAILARAKAISLESRLSDAS